MSEDIRPPFAPELAELLPGLEGFVPIGLTLADVERFRERTAIAPDQLIGDEPVKRFDHTFASFDGAEIAVSVLSRCDHEAPGPAIYHLHGGGMVMGNRFAGAAPLIEWALKHDAVCATVEYRLAPEHKAPVPVEDCYAGLCWLAGHARELSIDPTRIIVFGGSAGGGLAAGTALLARDRGGPAIAGQLLQCPMLDDRNDSISARQFDGIGVWDRQCNVMAWEALLGDAHASDNVDRYSAPGRHPDLRGLPPTFLDVGACEVYRDEVIEYARRISAAGGDCELHVWGGAFHGFYDIAPNTELAQQCLAAREAWLARLLNRLRI
jgi:acetyl esterase/lipase